MRVNKMKFEKVLLIVFLICMTMQSASARMKDGILIAQTLPTAPTFDTPNSVYRQYEHGANYPYVDISAQSGTTIFYTTDGSQPTSSSFLYSGRLYPSSTTQFNAIAIDSSGNQSPVSSLWMCLDAAANSIPATNQALWLRSDFGLVSSAGNVTRWVDLSGNGNDAAQATSVHQPTEADSQLNGFSVVNFTPGSSGQFLQMPSGFANFLSGATFVIVLKPTSSVTGATILDLGNGTASNNLSLSESSTSGGIQASVYNGSTASSVNAAAALTSNQFQLLTTIYDGTSTAALYKNGAQLAQNTSMQTANNIARAQNFLGQSSGGGNFFQGQIAEVMVYQAAITQTQRFAVESYLMSKYQIPNQIPVAPIFSSPSATFTSPSQVAISADGNSQIFWTNNGSTPTSSSNSYLAPLNISYTQTIKTIAISTLTGNSSAVSSATYTLNSTQWPAPSTGGPTLQINITSPSTSIPQ